MLALTLAGCSHRPNDFSAFSHVDDPGWRYGDTFVYMPQIADSVATGTMRVAVRHTNDYPYANLYVELSYQAVDPDGHLRLQADTVCIELADAYGHWLGSGLGHSYQKADTLSRDFTLISGAPLRVRHVMRADTVPGIEQVGFIFESNDTEQ